ncbi:uncharacterized protein LOC123321080 [Coccinella septempunctata]|uniref:uncharacterized protein LOC123321080 n=1 Tax=Coccinella septempunctata TaxID=41139 RepID=UPI001D05F640|nr:uncharacterized protein LOC123321080 [Coccinella septempunctata]
MHISKSDYEFLGPYEVVNCLDNGRYEIKKVGTNIVTKAAKEQLRRWPIQWALNVDMNEVLDFLESESDSVEREVRASTNSTPLQLLLGIQSSTPLIQALLKNVSKDLSSIRNRDLDRQRVAEKLSSTRDLNDVNKRRRDNVQYSPGDFVLMHRDSQMHISKSDYEFLGPYEVVNCLDNGRYEIKKVGTNIVTKAAKEQLRRWPIQWALNVDMNEVLDFLESESDSVEREDKSSGEKCVESVAVVRKAV